MRLDAPRMGMKELDGYVFFQRRCVDTGRRRQSLERIEPFFPYTQCLSRCGQYRNARSIREHAGDKCCPIKQVFKIIEYQQQCFFREIVEQLLVRLTFAVERQAKSLGDGRNEQIAPWKWL